MAVELFLKGFMFVINKLTYFFETRQNFANNFSVS